MILFIIWGSKGRTKTVDSGEFYCPNCRRSTPFQRLRASRYFTLYFIPLFPLENLGEWVQCQHCNSEFDDRVTQMSSSEIERAVSPWQCRHCENQNPAESSQCLGCGRTQDQ